jgi:hypothetical protein
VSRVSRRAAQRGPSGPAATPPRAENLNADTEHARPGYAESDASRRTDRVLGGNVVLAVVVAAWIVLLARYLSHDVVLTSDSVNNHVHVWKIADNLWHHGRLPWRFPQLGHGEAYAYPYGFVNWTTAALVWPLFGDWGVTLWTALGAVGCLVATFVAFPELRRGWWAAAVLANSAVVMVMMFGQQSFAWGSMLLLFGIAAWRRGRRGWAALLVGLGQLTHVFMVAPITFLLVVLSLPFTNDRRALLKWYAVSLLVALPAVVLVVLSPSASDARWTTQVANFFGTLGPRVLIAVVPIFLVLVRRLGWSWTAPAVLIVPLGFLIGLSYPLNGWAQWKAFARHHTNTASLDTLLESGQFDRAATSRVLRGFDGKLGLYYVVRAGGHLDSEMFPETMAIRDFRDVAEYERLLCDRGVDQIVHFTSYDAARHTNESSIIDQLAAGAGDAVRLHLVSRGPDHQVYTVDRYGCPGA